MKQALTHALASVTAQAERVAGAAARSSAEERAAQYLRARARASATAVNDDDEDGSEPFTTPAGANEPLDDGDDARRRMYAEPSPESGLAGVAERAILAAQREGAFANLSTKGAPLDKLLDPHDAQFFTLDASAALAARVLKTANYRRGEKVKTRARVRSCD